VTAGRIRELLKAVGGLKAGRVRFTSPHPAEFTDDVIEAMAATPTSDPRVHMPLQLRIGPAPEAMRRSYRASALRHHDRVRAADPERRHH